MKLVIISDTHNRESALGNLSGDVLIHCGDMFELSDPSDSSVERMDAWFGSLDFQEILCVGGNHDYALEGRFRDGRQVFRNATFLVDQAFVFDGVKFYGSPWTPDLSTHAFYKSDEDLERVWNAVPSDTDVLITHTPPFDVLDVCSWGLKLGCRHLAATVAAVKPAYHCFGHIHNSAGVLEKDDVTFINASSVNSALEIAYQPYEIHI